MSPNTVRKYITQLEDKYLIENLADNGVDMGRNREKRDAALYDPSHSRGGELQAGAGLVDSANPKARQEKAVKPNSPLCGDLWPVRGRGREVTPPKL